MKSTIYLLLFIVCLAPTVLCGQTVTSEKDLTRSELQWVMKKGFNIRKYDWQNEDVNFHLNLALDHHRSAPYLKYGGIGGWAVGTIIMLATMTNAIYYGDHVGAFGFGTVLFAGGSVCWFIGGKKEREARYNLDKAVNLNSE